MIEIGYKVVVDSSIVLAWVTKESKVDGMMGKLSALVTSGTLLVVPSIFWYEIANVLKTGKKQTAQEIKHTLKILAKLHIETVELSERLTDLSISYMFTDSLSFYDAVYAGLAWQLRVPLFTLDKQLQKVKSIEHI